MPVSFVIFKWKKQGQVKQYTAQSDGQTVFSSAWASCTLRPTADALHHRWHCLLEQLISELWGGFSESSLDGGTRRLMKDIYFNRWLAASAAATRMTCSFLLNFPHRRSQIRRAKGVNRLCTWLFFLCLLHMQRWQRSRRSDLSISSWLEVAGAIMGNGQEKKKTFSTRVLLASVLFTDCPCTLKVGAPLIGAGVCQKQLKQLTECLNAYFYDYI